MFTLNTAERHAVAYCMGHDERSAQFGEDIADPLTASDYKQPPVVAYGIDQQGGKGGANYTVDVVPTLCSDSHGTPHAVAYCIQGNMVDRETAMHGIGISENVSATLTATDRHAVAQESVYSIPHDERIATMTKCPLRGGQNAYAIGKRSNGSIEDAGQSGNAELYARSNSCHATSCDGKQTVGSLCAHDGRGFNGQDVAQGKLIIERHETDNDS